MIFFFLFFDFLSVAFFFLSSLVQFSSFPDSISFSSLFCFSLLHFFLLSSFFFFISLLIQPVAGYTEREKRGAASWVTAMGTRRSRRRVMEAGLMRIGGCVVDECELPALRSGGGREKDERC